MVAQDTLENRKKDAPSLDEITTILWTQEMGKRLALIRMRMMKDQSELAAEFGCSQASLSKIERGIIRVSDKFTVASLKRVFGNTFHFIFFGTNPERFNEGAIRNRYWDTRLRERRVNKSRYSNGRIY